MRSWQMAMATVFAATMAGAAPAGAAIVSGTYAFTATGFGGFADLSGAVTITFDNSANITNSTANITLDSLSFVLGSAISYTYNFAGDELTIGGLNFGATGIVSGTDDFILGFNGASGTAGGEFFGALQSSTTSPFEIGFTYTGTVTFTPAATVPEPSTLALLGLALAGLGAARRQAAPRPD